MTYTEVLERIAGHLINYYGQPVETSVEAATTLVNQCGLATIIAASTGLPRNQPRQTFGGEATSL